MTASRVRLVSVVWLLALLVVLVRPADAAIWLRTETSVEADRMPVEGARS